MAATSGSLTGVDMVFERRGGVDPRFPRRGSPFFVWTDVGGGDRENVSKDFDRNAKVFKFSLLGWNVQLPSMLKEFEDDLQF